MKKTTFAICSVVLMGFMTAQAGMKLGTVDMLKLVRNHQNYETNKSLMTETEKDYQRKLEKLRSELEKLSEEGKKVADQVRQPMLSASAKTKLEKELGDIQNKFMAGQQRLRSEAMRSEQELRELEARLLKGTTSDLKKRITAFAISKGYDMILDSSATPFYKAEYDVTDGILKTMGVDPKQAKSVETTPPKKNEGK